MSLDVVCFDCDSTLSKIEGIDELARRVGLGEELAKLTDAAMNGEVDLEDIYGKRLDLIKPNRVAIEWLADFYIAELVDGVKEVFSELQKHNKEIHIISGGLLPAILPLAELLNVPVENVHAVDIYFAENGDYLDYETNSPLAKNGGKAAIIKSLNSTKLVMIGDGKTDLEAQQAGAKVIGFGGVVNRKLVRENADFFVADENLMAILPFLGFYRNVEDFFWASKVRFQIRFLYVILLLFIGYMVLIQTINTRSAIIEFDCKSTMLVLNLYFINDFIILRTRKHFTDELIKKIYTRWFGKFVLLLDESFLNSELGYQNFIKNIPWYYVVLWFSPSISVFIYWIFEFFSSGTYKLWIQTIVDWSASFLFS